LGYVDKEYSTVEGVGAFFNNRFGIMISDFLKNFPTGPTANYLSNGKVKLLNYDDQGKLLQKLMTTNNIPVFRENLQLPDSKD